MFDGINNFIQVFNELCILIVFCFSFAFTEAVPDPVVRFSYGDWFLYAIFFNLSVNASILLYQILALIKKHVVRRYNWFLFE